MIRLLIFGGLMFLGYKEVKSWILKNIEAYTISSQARAEIDDIMVQDPFCKVYFPKREGAPLNVDGKTLHFCSIECRNKFIESRS
ncbi:hypothetical protein QUF72_07790 [Desulfobacterales bacterium HSG2]|nr:hypothetical protein [Desulfobacterales bacterium HSG2]